MLSNDDNNSTKSSNHPMAFNNEDINLIVELCQNYLENDELEPSNKLDARTPSTESVSSSSSSSSSSCLPPYISEESNSIKKRRPSFPEGLLKKSKISKNPLYSFDEERMHFLMQYPEKYQRAWNEGNLNMIKKILYDYCTPDIVLKVFHIPALTGYEQLLHYFEMTFKQSPDLLVATKPPTRNHRVITSKVCTEGTFTRFDSDDNIMNLFRCGIKSPLISDATYAKYDELERENKVMIITSTFYMHLILNDNMTHFDKMITTFKKLEVKDGSSKYEDSKMINFNTHSSLSNK